MSSGVPPFAEHGYSDAKRDVPGLSAVSFVPVPLGTANGSVYASEISWDDFVSHVNLTLFVNTPHAKRANGTSYTGDFGRASEGEVAVRGGGLFVLVDAPPIVLFFSMRWYFVGRPYRVFSAPRIGVYVVVVYRKEFYVCRFYRAAFSSRYFGRVPRDSAALDNCVLLVTGRVLGSQRHAGFSYVNFVIAVTCAGRRGAYL